ncbi:MAG TPA: hypothetical protein VIH99_00920 [Bdellovibrionota bacterium]|jgi:hypothetical protein
MSADLARVLHDLHAPLARALSYYKLLEEADAEEARKLLPPLGKALHDLQTLLKKAEDELPLTR